jgi:hypothetical protein
VLLAALSGKNMESTLFATSSSGCLFLDKKRNMNRTEENYGKDRIVKKPQKNSPDNL